MAFNVYNSRSAASTRAPKIKTPSHENSWFDSESDDVEQGTARLRNDDKGLRNNNAMTTQLAQNIFIN